MMFIKAVYLPSKLLGYVVNLYEFVKCQFKQANHVKRSEATFAAFDQAKRVMTRINERGWTVCGEPSASEYLLAHGARCQMFVNWPVTFATRHRAP